MTLYRRALVVVILPLAAATIFACTYTKAKNAMYLCRQPYALCTSALCVPQPTDPNKAICFCVVEDGASMSTVPCSQLQTSTDTYGIQTIYSTYSLKQSLEGKKGMKCPSGTPWTWCLNKQCTVDPSDPNKAICICDIIRTGTWMTLGGDCDTSTCATGYWSGATLESHAQGSDFLIKKLGLEHSPVKWCPSP